MKNTKPILIIEDDLDDCELIEAAFKAIGVRNKIVFFHDGEQALRFLKTSPINPFLIISDVNMPKLSGIQLKNEINKDEELREKSIPFVFMSTAATDKDVCRAYETMAQGFFQKPASFEEIKEVLLMITRYWDTCRHPVLN